MKLIIKMDVGSGEPIIELGRTDNEGPGWQTLARIRVSEIDLLAKNEAFVLRAKIAEFSPYGFPAPTRWERDVTDEYAIDLAAFICTMAGHISRLSQERQEAVTLPAGAG